METKKDDLLSAIVEGSPYAKILIDDRGRIALVNAQTEMLFGYTRDALLGKSIELLVPERFRGEHPGLRGSFAHQPLARPMGAGRDLYGRRSDGTEIAIEIGLNPIRTDSGTFVLAAVTDITERRQAEQARLRHAIIAERADQVEALNRELSTASLYKTQFVATMSHELRTPLTAIIGAAELLDRTDLDERDRLHVQTITSAAEALLAVINSILDFSKIEAGKLDLKSTSFLAETVIESAADVSAQLARAKGITLHTFVDAAIPPLLGDFDRLRQILMNLLANAVKFTDEGQVVVRALLAGSATNDEIGVRFEVVDTGIGITPEMQAQLFEPFVQADPSSTRRFGGTGLGLSISKRLVQLMGGEIGIESEPNKGTSFWFTARFRRASEPIAVQARWLDGVTGLILSGDDMFAEIVERYMHSWHMQSCRAASRSELVTILQARRDSTWVAIVDADDVGAADLSDALEIVRAVAPARFIGVGGSGPMRKPVRQSYLYDAIVKASKASPPVGGPGPSPVPPQAPQIRPVDPIPLEPLHSDLPVLVAEDNTQLQELLGLQFERLGLSVTFVSDGLEVIDALRTGSYAMLFMDCHMPNLDGLSATRSIRAEEIATGRHIHITAMTANAFVEDRAECLAAGMDDYLAKPVRLVNLRAAIECGLKSRT